MSFDLAVWEGERPADGREAAAVFEDFYNRYTRAGEMIRPSPAIRRFVETLTQRWPDTLDEFDDSPWAEIPLIDSACGPYIYFAMSYRPVTEEATFYVAQVAREQSLVCFDPQGQCLML
jgi:hypothetical protein